MRVPRCSWPAGTRRRVATPFGERKRASTAALGPNISSAPFFSKASLSSAAISAGLWVTMITVTPRALSSASAASKAASPAVSRFAFGSSSTTQARLAVQRASQRDALALAAGQHRAAVADLRVVAVGQLQDHFVRMSEPRRANDPFRGFGAGHCAEARDVLADRAGEQLDVLRQIADVLAERVAIPARCPRRRDERSRPAAATGRAAAESAWSCRTRWGR